MVRIAVVQMDFHPAFSLQGRSLLAEPLGHFADGPDGTMPLEGVPSRELEELRTRIESEYEKALSRKLSVILEHCRRWDVQLVVFPEYAIPAACLSDVAEAAGDMVVVAGTHHVRQLDIRSGVYQDLGAPVPPRGTAVSPVISGGRALALVPKCRASPIAGESASLNHGEGWAPVELPERLPGPLGVAICIDFIAGELPSCAAPGASLADVRLWAVPSLTPTTEDFHLEARKQAKRRKKPVAYANSKHKGRSGVFVDIRDDVDLLVPLILGEKEEGVVVADVSWQRPGPGRATAFDEPPVVVPVAAASFVYTATIGDQAYGAWLESLEQILSTAGGDVLGSVELEDHVRRLDEQISSTKHSTRRHRIERLVNRLSGLTKDEQLQCLTREVVFPEDVLPLEGLRAALARGARDVLHGWQERGSEGTDELRSTIERYRREARAVFGHGNTAWVARARQEAERVAQVVRAGARKENHELEQLVERLTVYSGAVDEGLDRDFKAAAQAMDDERFEEARKALAAILERAEKLVDADPEREGPRAWRARVRLMKAITLFNLNDVDAAASEVRLLEREALPPAHWRDLVVLLAELGEVTDARAFLDAAAGVELSEQTRTKLDRAALHVDVCAGQRPRELPEDTPDLLRKAAQLELQQGRLADAVRHARRAAELEPLARSTTLIALHVLVTALERSVFERGSPGGWLTQEEQAEAIETIEAWLVHVDAWEREGLPLPSSLYDSIRRCYFDLVEDDGRMPAGVPRPGPSGPGAELVSLAAQGQVEQALEKLDELPSTGSPWLDELRRIDLLVRARRAQQAFEHLTALARRFPDRGPIEYKLAQTHAHRGELEDAKRHAERAVERLPCSGHRLLLAECLHAMGLRERAWSILTGDRERGGPRTLQLLARLAERLHPAEALPLWERFVAVVPDDTGARIEHALALRRAGRAQDAAEHAWSVFERHGDELSAKDIYTCAMLQDLGDGKGLTLVANDRMKRASMLLAELHWANPEAHAFRLEIRTRMGEEDDAAPIDIRLLEEAGLAMRFSDEETDQRLLELDRRGRAVRHALWQLYAEGGAPLEAIATAEGRPVAELVIEMLEGEDTRRFCSQISLKVPIFDPAEPLELLLGATELLLLVELDLEDEFHAAMRRRVASVVIHEDAWQRLRMEREADEPATDSRRRAARLARRTMELVEAGQHEQWLLVRDWAELIAEGDVPAIPLLRDSTVDEALFRQPLERGLRLVESTRSKPGRWRVTVDFFATWGMGHPLLAQVIAWCEPTEYLRVAEHLRRGLARTMSFPSLVRLLVDWVGIDERRRVRIFTRLARRGFIDALTAEDLVVLSRVEVGLSRYDSVLGGLEHMARASFLGVAEPAQLRIVNTYARVCFLANLQDEDMKEVVAGELTNAMLSRVENLGQRGELLELVLVQIGAMVLDQPRAAFIVAPDGGDQVTFSHSTPTGRLWARLNEWAGQDGRRRRALDRALRSSWCLLDRLSGEGGPSLQRSAPLMLAGDFERGTGPATANEALVILSAQWKDQPLEFRTFTVENSGHSTTVSYPDCVRHAIGLLAKGELDGVISMDEREIDFWYPLGPPLGPIPARVPVEGVVLRTGPAEARTVLEDLRWQQGRHDGGAYRLIGEILDMPEDPDRRRAYARHSVSALWRLVRDDPSYLLQWPRQRSTINGSWPTVEILCEILHEPLGAISSPAGAAEVLSKRLNETWANLHENVLGALFYQSMRLPGGLAASSIGPRLRPHIYLEQVEDALARLEEPTRHPAGILANDVMFLRVAMAHQPEVELRGGPLDLREIVPSRFEALIASENHRPPGSLADDEPRLLRAMAIVVKELLARRSGYGAHDYLWLTYRLHGWFLDQLAATEQESKATGLSRIRAIASRTAGVLPSEGGDLLDPFTFDARGFDYRLAVILFAMLAMEGLVRVPGLVGTVGAVEPPPVSTKGLEDHLLELARSDHPATPHASSWFPWRAPDNVPDLALLVLLQLHPERVLDLGEEHLSRRIVGWPEDIDAQPEPRRQIIDGIVRVLATRCSALDQDTRRELRLKLTALEDGNLARKLRWLGMTGLYSAGASDLESRVRASLAQNLTEPEAPMMASLFLQALAADEPQKLDVEVTHLYEAWRSTPDRAGEVLAGEALAVEVLTFAVARLVIPGDTELARRAGRLLAELAERPGFRDDPRLRALLEHLHIEDETP